MTTWIIVSWVAVAILTGVNIFAFIKLKNMSQQMMKMAFPNAKNPTDALDQMQTMMKTMQSPNGGFQMNRRMRRVQGKMGGGAGPQTPMPNPAQMKAAMDMLSKLKAPK